MNAEIVLLFAANVCVTSIVVFRAVLVRSEILSLE